VPKGNPDLTRNLLIIMLLYYELILIARKTPQKGKIGYMNTLRQQLNALDIEPGDVLFMHSSMKALGPGITPEGFLRELMETLTGEGTLLLPAFTYETVSAKQPIFSVAANVPCVGKLPATFMRMEGVLRSIHPTHSVCAWGKRADELTRRHILDDTPVGPHSPLMLLPGSGGKLLFVGDILYSCTFVHGIEEIVAAPYVLSEEQTLFKLVDAAKVVSEKKYYTIDFSGWKQEYDRIRDILTYPDMRFGKVGEANCTLIDAEKLCSALTARFREDIYAFVSRTAQ
jgi:aminoglycoside 3-N-acetyltransferase